MLKENLSLTQEKIITSEETASKVASGALEVFSTPMLIAFMESTAFNLVQPHLSNDDTTVGISINVNHLKANLVGDKICCGATLTKIDGKKLSFDIKVFHNDILVGQGTHDRFIVNTEKFLSKLGK